MLPQKIGSVPGVDAEHRLMDWADAERRIASHPPRERRLLDELTERVLDELRRRVGRPFVLQELAWAYEDGTTWAVEIITEAAPHDPWAWAPNLAVDAAFSRYARFAQDVGGGRWTGAPQKSA